MADDIAKDRVKVVVELDRADYEAARQKARREDDRSFRALVRMLIKRYLRRGGNDGAGSASGRRG
jgi:hypothetical protein